MTTPEFTTQAFLDWLRQQPKERAFNYWSHEECACATFCKEALGWSHAIATGTHVGQCDGPTITIPKVVAESFLKLANRSCFTAGQLLEKLTII